jgi:glycosyltransferase involved in cell wall biosynthesis
MVSFRHKLTDGLKARGIAVCNDLTDTPYQAVLVIGGTRQLPGLWQLRRGGVRIVQRLDGMNWLHRLGMRKSPQLTRLRHFLRAEYGNWILSMIRGRLANHIVYQSAFTHQWWERVHGATPVPSTVIHNGVDLKIYTPDGSHQRPQDRQRILMVEGSLMGGYELGLEVAVELVKYIRRTRPQYKLELMVVGRVPPDLQKQWEQQLADSPGISVVWTGLVLREKIPEIDRSAHLLYSADINAACPNAVIEALSCGLPVLAFDTGALPEMVTRESGQVVPYGSNPWQLETPNIEALAQAAGRILDDQERFRRAARQRAEQAFDLETMVDAYLDVLLG